MSAKKIVIIVLSSALALLLGFCTFWVINNYDAIEHAMSGSALYTNADLEKAYEDGYNSAGYDVQDLNDQIADLRNKLETKTAEFNQAKANYNEYLKKYNDLATLSEEEKAELNATINALNDEIADLENDIANLNTTLDSYIEFKEQVEAENIAVATFEYDSAVILVQSYEKGAKLENVVIPEDTDEITFNGWTVNGQAVDISDYTINESTTFVADLSFHYYCTINFYVDNVLYNSQRVLVGSTLSLPENPAKDNYNFLGWSFDELNIVEVDLDNISESKDYYAVFSLLNNFTLTTYEDIKSYPSVYTCGNGVYAGISDSSSSGTFYYSSDGVNWSQKKYSDYESKWSCIVFANNMFVALTDHYTNNYYAYSFDGINWSFGKFSQSVSQFTSISYGNNLFVAVSNSITNSYQCIYSSDGINWFVGNLPIEKNFEKVFYFKNVFYAFHRLDSFSYCFYSSSDGKTWTSSIVTVDENDYIRDLVVSEDCIYILTSEKIYRSCDGLNFQEFLVLPEKFDTTMLLCVYNDCFFVFSYRGNCYFYDGFEFVSFSLPDGINFYLRNDNVVFVNTYRKIHLLTLLVA